MTENPAANGLVTWVAEDPVREHDPHASTLTEPLDRALDKQNLRGNSIQASISRNPYAILITTPILGHAIFIGVEQLGIGYWDVRSERWVRHEHVDASKGVSPPGPTPDGALVERQANPCGRHSLWCLPPLTNSCSKHAPGTGRNQRRRDYHEQTLRVVPGGRGNLLSESGSPMVPSSCFQRLSKCLRVSCGKTRLCHMPWIKHTLIVLGIEHLNHQANCSSGCKVLPTISPEIWCLQAPGRQRLWHQYGRRQSHSVPTRRRGIRGRALRA